VSSGGAQAAPYRRLHQLRGTLWTVLLLLALQFVLGMALNLWVPLSLPSGYSQVASVLASNGLVSAHAVVAVLLIILSAMALLLARGLGLPRMRALSGILILTLVLTSMMGYSFVESQSNAFSFAMALGFILALLESVMLLHLTYHEVSAHPRPGALPA
jgi:hypothetical protein